MIRTLLLLLSITLLPCNAAASAERCTIVVLGDSLSAAYGLSTEQGWVHLLVQRLADEGSPCKVVNASVSGETTQGGRARLAAILEQHQPSHLLIELGANNGLRGLPMDSMQQDLAAMIHLAQQQQIKPLLIGMRMPPNYGPLYTQQFTAVYSKLATAHKVPLVPFLLNRVADHSELMQSDALHPNAKGQPQLLKNVWPTLKTLLPSPS